jgi:hypothetical protein
MKRFDRLVSVLLFSTLALPLTAWALQPADELSASTPGPYSPPNFCANNPVNTYDMVQWMVQTYPNHQTSYLQAHDRSSTLSVFTTPVGSRFYRISGFNGSPGSAGNEVYDYDGLYVYIRRETRFSSPSDFNYHPTTIWAPRIAVTLASNGHACGNFQTDRHYDYYTNCVNQGRRGANFIVTVDGPYATTIGGNVGTVPALRLSNLNLSTFETEEYWYAMTWGMVMYRLYDSNNVFVRQEVFDTIFPNQPPLVLQCGIGY